MTHCGRLGKWEREQGEWGGVAAAMWHERRTVLSIPFVFLYGFAVKYLQALILSAQCAKTKKREAKNQKPKINSKKKKQFEKQKLNLTNF